MKIGKKLLAVLVLACLLINTVPAASAAETEVRLSAVVDYSDLELQVAIANGLNSYDYTMQTWSELQKAVNMGQRYLKGKYGQQAVNEAVAAIETAMDGLEKMDYSRLETALGMVYNKIDENPDLHDAWAKLNAAETKARPLLISGDQAAVDAAAEELLTLLDDLNQKADAAMEPEVVVQEVEVEVLPTDDYCNIPMHRTWPVLFMVSAALNVALLAALIFVIVRKRKTVDNTPLVNYDIDDDMDF